ncbi:MAG: transcriptional regulator, partial [Actinomycetia bacterium]|nr:transcriptional regulator [Actinomycetes bacterium]
VLFGCEAADMRADRLVALLMLLQTKGQVTAGQVAEELEISERTARRDLEALGMAGVPIYSQPGRNGGWRLLGGAKTDLSGLNAAEARALFLVAGPASQATPEVKAALRKLVRALPETFRESAEAASQAIVVDPTSWGDRRPERPPPPLLDYLQQAVIDGEQVELGYVARDRAETTRVVHPLGLAAKGHTWYLIADTAAGQRTFRVDRVTSAVRTGEPVVRPEGFDLNQAWQDVTENVEGSAPMWARGTVVPEMMQILRWQFGPRLRIGPAREDGRIAVEVGGWHPHQLAGMVAGLGADVEITDPPEVRTELARIGAELLEQYA